VTGFAVGAAVGSLAATLVLCALTAPAVPEGTFRDTVKSVLVAAVLLVVLLLTEHIPLLWLACAAIGGVLALRPDLVRTALHRRVRR
jgi:hypothetical protein